ncbi:hypothetical protein NQ315_014316 [Exocentrus adspersus]|uniref:TPPP family protein n=1 Tax=Exocentrus adspersus TaxID=1586481 RepID=A0AAV8VL27_9CUCU|nr:hypothetical protein NQ315_014316 [Exocentrus adspersus]
MNFAKFGDMVKMDGGGGKMITLTQIDKWFKQADIFNKELTMTDTGLTFIKFKVRAIPYHDFLKFLEDLANQKDIPVEQLKEKLQTCGVPGTGKPKEGKETHG